MTPISQDILNALISESWNKLYGDNGNALTISYSFIDSRASYYQDYLLNQQGVVDKNSFHSLSIAQEQAFERAASAWASVANAARRGQF